MDAVPAEEEYPSCEWIEGGIAFNRRSLHTCLIAHHHTGLPFIEDYEGGTFPLEKVLAVREQIRQANRSGGGHPQCAGCAHLKKQRWPEPKHAIEIVGIAHYSFCNIKCSYCFLQTQDPASFASGYKPYSLVPVVRDLIEKNLLAPTAIIDWGGGEPTYYKEFDALMDLLLAHGTFHYIHSNGTRVPESLRRATATDRIHVICSVDAGLPETYFKIKKRDYLERVWANLEEYISRGMKVTLKYITKTENCGEADTRAFMERALKIGARDLIIDIDYDFPDPGEDVIAALARMRHAARRAGMHSRFGFTGDNFAAENEVARRVKAAYQTEQLAGVSRLLAGRGYAVDEAVDLTVEQLVGVLETHCSAKDDEIRRQHEAIGRQGDEIRRQYDELVLKEAEIQRRQVEIHRKEAALQEWGRPGVILRKSVRALLRKAHLTRAAAGAGRGAVGKPGPGLAAPKAQ